MNKINHHPNDDILLGFVGGSLDTAYNLALATHVSMCSQCQKTVQRLQAIGGNVLESGDKTGMSVSAQDVLANENSIKVETPMKLKAKTSEKHGFEVPAIVNSLIEGDFDELKWQTLSPSLKQHVLDLDGKATARFLWMKAGKAVPAHGHTGEELTMVLTGGYFDGDEPFTKGDLQWAAHKAPHMPIAMEDAPCIVLAVTDSPLVFRNILPRLFQPFFKI